MTRNLVLKWLRPKERQLVTTSLDLESLLFEQEPADGDTEKFSFNDKPKASAGIVKHGRLQLDVKRVLLIQRSIQ